MERIERIKNHLTRRKGPLAGVRVLDMSSVVSGPWASSILADQGADVVKVEGTQRPDLTRSLGPSPPGHGGMAAMYVTVNRSKRTIALDLSKAQGVEVLKRLVTSIDVVLQNFRPGVADRLGVGYKDLSALNPGLVMMSISGYGSTGPLSTARTYDQVIQAMSGVGEIVKSADGKPALFYNLFIDKVTALYASQSITAALFGRAANDGRGQHVKINMLDSALHFLFLDAYWNRVWMEGIKPFPNEWRDIHKKSEYDAADGRVAISLTGAKELLAILRLLGLPLPADPARAAKDPMYLQECRIQTVGPIRREIRKMTRQQIFDGCLAAGVPCGKFNTIDEVLVEPQVRHNKSVLELHSPIGGHSRSWRTPKLPTSFMGTPVSAPSMAPLRGEHSDQVLRESGFTAQEITALREALVVA